MRLEGNIESISRVGASSIKSQAILFEHPPSQFSSGCAARKLLYTRLVGQPRLVDHRMPCLSIGSMRPPQAELKRRSLSHGDRCHGGSLNMQGGPDRTYRCASPAALWDLLPLHDLRTRNGCVPLDAVAFSPCMTSAYNTRRADVAQSRKPSR